MSKSNVVVHVSTEGTVTVTGLKGKPYAVTEVVGLEQYLNAQVTARQVVAAPVVPASPAPVASATRVRPDDFNPLTDCHVCYRKAISEKQLAHSTTGPLSALYEHKPTCICCQRSKKVLACRTTKGCTSKLDYSAARKSVETYGRVACSACAKKHHEALLRLNPNKKQEVAAASAAEAQAEAAPPTSAALVGDECPV